MRIQGQARPGNLTRPNAPPQTHRSKRPRPSRIKLARSVRAERRTTRQPEERPVRPVCGDERDQLAARQRRYLCAAGECGRDDRLCEAARGQERAGVGRQRGRVPQAPP